MQALTSGLYYFVDVKEGHDELRRHVLEESDWIKFKEDLSEGRKFVRVGKRHLDNFRISEFGELKIDTDALVQMRKLEKPIQEFVKKRILLGYRVSSMDDLRFSVALYYEHTNTT